MHSIGVRYRPKALCAPAFCPPAISRRGVRRTRSVGPRRKTFAITLFQSRRNTSKTPCASRDPYPGRSALAAPPYGAGQLVRLRPCTRQPRAPRRRGAFQTGSSPDCPECRFPPSASFTRQRPNLAGPSAMVWRPPARQAPRAACLDERRRIVDSRCDPRTYVSARAACARSTLVWAIEGITHRCTT